MKPIVGKQGYKKHKKAFHFFFICARSDFTKYINITKIEHLYISEKYEKSITQICFSFHNGFSFTMFAF